MNTNCAFSDLSGDHLIKGSYQSYQKIRAELWYQRASSAIEMKDVTLSSASSFQPVLLHAFVCCSQETCEQWIPLANACTLGCCLFTGSLENTLIKMSAA